MNCISCRALILPDEPTESCEHGFKCEACTGQQVDCPACILDRAIQGHDAASDPDDFRDNYFTRSN